MNIELDLPEQMWHTRHRIKITSVFMINVFSTGQPTFWQLHAEKTNHSRHIGRSSPKCWYREVLSAVNNGIRKLDMENHHLNFISSLGVDLGSVPFSNRFPHNPSMRRKIHYHSGQRERVTFLSVLSIFRRINPTIRIYGVLLLRTAS